MAILERVGVVVPHAEVLRRFADCGADVAWEEQRVRIPPALVARSLAQAGKQFTLYGRDPSRTAAFGCGRRNYNSIAGEALWVETLGGDRRYATLADVALAACVGDALGSINVVGAMADPQEIPVAYRCVAVMATLLRNTTKPFTFWYHDRASARYLNEMLIAVRGDRQRAAAYPLCYPFLEPISPLRFPFHGVDLLFETATLNLPVPIGPMAQMGLSAPATIAGTLAQENAEILAGLCITQLIRPGLPVCYGGICHAFDMRTTQLTFAGPEQAIFGVAMTQIGKHYGLPVYINVGLTLKRADTQAGLEAGVTLALGPARTSSGTWDQRRGPGRLLDILVLQDEVIAYVESILREIGFSDEALGFAEIAAVGPGGSFIDRGTARHFRRELWFPRLLDRDYYQAWRDAGALLRSTATGAWSAPAQPHPEPLSPDLDRALRRSSPRTEAHEAGSPAGRRQPSNITIMARICSR